MIPDDVPCSVKGRDKMTLVATAGEKGQCTLAHSVHIVCMVMLTRLSIFVIFCAKNRLE